MTQEEKAQRYDEAIEKLRSLHDDYDTVSTLIDIKEELENIFPELKESEDERIRKAMIDFFKHEREEGITVLHYGVNIERMIAWLERQGNKDILGNAVLDGNEDGLIAETIKYKNEKQGEHNPTDKVEPKFKIGDKIRKKTPSSFDRDMQVARIEKDYYVCNHIGKFSSEVVPFSKQTLYELIEQKLAAWSEEDEMVLDALIRRLEGEDIHVSPHLAVKCLKSLKDRVWPRQEWSEEDEKMMSSFLHKVEVCNLLTNKENVWIINKLKSFRPQNTWKPSDEQMEALDSAQAELCSTEYNKPICDLIDNLKKLKGE